MQSHVGVVLTCPLVRCGKQEKGCLGFVLKPLPRTSASTPHRMSARLETSLVARADSTLASLAPAACGGWYSIPSTLEVPVWRSSVTEFLKFSEETHANPRNRRLKRIASYPLRATGEGLQCSGEGRAVAPALAKHGVKEQ